MRKPEINKKKLKQNEVFSPEKSQVKISQSLGHCVLLNMKWLFSKVR